MKPERENFSLILTLALLAVIAFCLPQTYSPAADYPYVSGPCNLRFPLDHASHPDHRVEWWYYTGNLLCDDGARYGFELTFFRIRAVPVQEGKLRPGRPSEWRADQVFVVHAAVSDISSNEFLHSEKMSRAALQLGGVREREGRFEVFVNGCEAVIAPGLHHLSAKAADFSFTLDLVPRKNPVVHGESGLSRKGEGPGEASCYYSFSRLEAAGNVTVGGRERPVHGTAWMDHEFMSAPLGPRLAGWDWFSLQLSDGSELMIYLMREKNGEYSPVSSGTFVDSEGKSTRLFSKDFRVRVLGTWKSPHSGGIYPALWLLEVNTLDLRIRILPNMADQEMQTPGSTRLTYWEGSVRAEGSGPQGRAVTAEGYVELTGYAGPVEF
ncbi:MAG: lipocalin-like domain-containing protein [Syntrophobacteraceae bacterium]|jgi:predicted secreted hydrolase